MVGLFCVLGLISSAVTRLVILR